MSDHKHVNIKAEAANLRNILTDLIGFAKEEDASTRVALEQARSWLANITAPLTDEQPRKDVWEDLTDLYGEDAGDVIFSSMSDEEIRDYANPDA